MKRKLQILEIADVKGCHDLLFRIFKKLGPTLQSLTIAGDSKLDDFTLREILRNCESIESLVLSEVVIVKKLPAIQPVNMRSLKSLTISHCDWGVIKFINAQLTSFDVKSYVDEGSARGNVFSFLAQQNQLKDLKLRGTSSRTLFMQDEIVTSCCFDLRNFHLEHDFGKNSDNVNWHITAFLSLHVESLRKVEISGPNYEHIIGFAIANLDHLESLAIDVRSLPRNEQFYENLQQEPNTRLKKLSLRGFFVQPDAIKKILKKYRAIESLELNDWGAGAIVSELLTLSSKLYPSLTDLSISEISSGSVAKFESMTSFSVTCVRIPTKFMQFIKANPSIETLKIGLVYIGMVTPGFVEKLKNLKSIKSLVFGGTETALQIILEMMKASRTPTNLKTLQLSLVTDEKSLASSEKICKYFFPIHKHAKLGYAEKAPEPEEES